MKVATQARPDDPLAAEVAAAVGLDKRAIARLVSRFEDSRPSATAVRARAVALLAGAAHRQARVIGLTGTPGAGKSSLVGELATRMLAAQPGLAIAVLAVDPSSPVSGGALLGDRTRVRFPPGERRLYFRSQSSDRELGGIGRATFQAGRALARLFDVVFVETVGIGQSELEIVRIADSTILVLQPHGGDHVQFMKAGIMEVPDAFVINKADLEGASATYHALRASLRLGVPGAAERPVYRTSARSGAGVDELAAAILAAPPSAGLDARLPWFFERWVTAEYGRWGLTRLASQASSTASYLDAHGGFDAAQAAFAAAVT